jgi:hypothetical protein
MSGWRSAADIKAAQDLVGGAFGGVVHKICHVAALLSEWMQSLTKSKSKEKESASFFEKKEAKKLLLLRALARACQSPQ